MLIAWHMPRDKGKRELDKARQSLLSNQLQSNFQYNIALSCSNISSFHSEQDATLELGSSLIVVSSDEIMNLSFSPVIIDQPTQGNPFHSLIARKELKDSSCDTEADSFHVNKRTIFTLKQMISIYLVFMEKGNFVEIKYE